MFGKLRRAEARGDRFWTECFGVRMCGAGVGQREIKRVQNDVGLSVLV